MSATYDLAQLAAQPKYQVRAMTLDTDVTRAVLQDEEIDLYLSITANTFKAAAFACRLIAGRMKGLLTKRVGSLTLTYGATEYQALADRLDQMGNSHQLPIFTGQTTAEKEGNLEDLSVVHSFFARRMHDDPLTRIGQPPTANQNLQES